ncbi:MAG: hypothetical protein JJ863_25180 [Deltaproteobacteria bacterium]|nr:hypothetical protein [Deltaproteobacteria bacterium]
MEYRSPTRQPALEAAEREEQLDAHIERSQRAREAKRAKAQRRARVFRIVHWSMVPLALVFGGLGLAFDSSALKLVALACLIGALFGGLYRLLAKIPARDGGGLGGSSGIH